MFVTIVPYRVSHEGCMLRTLVPCSRWTRCQRYRAAHGSPPTWRATMPRPLLPNRAPPPPAERDQSGTGIRDTCFSPSNLRYRNFFCFPFSHLSVASGESGKSGSSLGKEDLRYVTKLIFFTFIQYCGSDPASFGAAGYMSMSVFYAHGPSRLMRKCSEILNLSFFVWINVFMVFFCGFIIFICGDFTTHGRIPMSTTLATKT